MDACGTHYARPLSKPTRNEQHEEVKLIEIDIFQHAVFSSDAQLLERVTYEGFAKAWPSMPDTGDFGERMNSMAKYVVSTTLTNAEWQNSTIISKNVVEEIQHLKEQSGQNILVDGSGKLVHTLMQHHLVDEFRCIIYPVVLGSGKRLFPEGSEKYTFKLMEIKAFKTGVVILHYQPDKG